MTVTPREPWSRNLLHTFEELVAHLGDVLGELGREETWPRALVWDAFLTICAQSQVLDDFLHRGFTGLSSTLVAASARPRKLETLGFLPPKLVAQLPGLVGSRAVRLGAAGIDAVVATGVRLRVRAREHSLVDLAGLLHDVACDAAVPLMGAVGAAAAAAPELLSRLTALNTALVAAARSARLGERVLKIPACFRDFDCHPEDCEELVRRFVARGVPKGTPLTVVGVRTSGSYLGPLCVAALRREGYADVRLMSMRQKVPLFAAEQAFVRARGQAGRMLVVDDPPVSGSTLSQVTATLVATGVPAAHILSLVLAEPDAPFFRTPLARGIDAVCLPRSAWRIARVLGEIASARNDRSRGDASTARSHARTRLAAPGASGGGGLVAKGVGVGWYDAYAEETGLALADFVAPGTRAKEGVLVTGWVDGPSLAERPDACDERLLRHVGRYVAARARRLPICSGRDGDIEDRATGWQTLAVAFARSYSLLAPLAYRDLRRRLADIGATAPRAAIDGRMDARTWIFVPDRPAPIKVDFQEHAFDRSDTAVLDPVFDLAAFSLGQELTREDEALLVAAYEEGSGDPVSAERLACCKLIAGLGRRRELDMVLAGGAATIAEDAAATRAAALERTRLDRRLSAAANHFLATVLNTGGGEITGAVSTLVAIDIDGVLEDGALGFTATTPAGALALRALRRHGVAAVLASGRSLIEIAERSRIFGLRAGIAEYGSVVWIDGDSPIELVSDDERRQLATLRTCLAGDAGMIVDEAYTRSVRVFQQTGAVRRAVALETITSVLAREGLDCLRVIPGEDQIDVVGAGCNKGRALALLRERLAARAVHAVGDTAEDVAMLDIADHAWTPANGRRATASARRPVVVARHRRARGLLEIARRVVHGRDGSCVECRSPESVGRAEALLDAFAIRDRGRIVRMLDLVRPGALDPLRISR